MNINNVKQVSIQHDLQVSFIAQFNGVIFQHIFQTITLSPNCTKTIARHKYFPLAHSITSTFTYYTILSPGLHKYLTEMM